MKEVTMQNFYMDLSILIISLMISRKLYHLHCFYMNCILYVFFNNQLLLLTKIIT